MQMLLESSFFCTQQVMKRLHSEEAATAGEGGVTRTVIKIFRGRRGGRQRVFAASSLEGAAREKYAATEAAVAENRGFFPKRGEKRASDGEPRSGTLGPMIGFSQASRAGLSAAVRAQRARGDEINTAKRQNRFRTCRSAVF
jgi:hypothetical protein